MRIAFALIPTLGFAPAAAAQQGAVVCPNDQTSDFPCAQTRSPLFHKEPQIIGEAWRNGRAEVDEGQGLFGQYTPEAVDWLADRGIQFFGWYMVALHGNPVGGLDNTFDYAGLFDFGIDLDMETMAGVKGFWIHISASSATGGDLTEDVGAFAPVNAVFSGVSFRLFEMYVEERFLRDRVSIRVGRIAVGWEYGLDYDYFTQYMSAAFRLNVFGLDPNTPNFTVIPFANWGARLRWTPNENWRLQASWMNGFPRDFDDDDKHGVDFRLEPTKGSFFILEGSYQWVPTRAQRHEKPERLPGRVTFGAFYDTGTFERVDSSGGTDDVLGSAYAIVRQKVWEPAFASDRGINLWTAGTVSGKQSIVALPYFWSGGLVWNGPFRRLPKDTLVFGWAMEFFSRELPDQSFETVLEAAYSFNPTTWITITPDIQYIIRPSGLRSIDNALVAGVLLYFTL